MSGNRVLLFVSVGSTGSHSHGRWDYGLTSVSYHLKEASLKGMYERGAIHLLFARSVRRLITILWSDCVVGSYLGTLGHDTSDRATGRAEIFL